MTEKLGVVDEETRIVAKVEMFQNIVESKLEGAPSPSQTATSRMKLERYKGGFVVFYEQGIENGTSYFTIEEPFSGIGFEFSVEDEDKIRRSIMTGDQISNPPEGKDVLDADVLITSRILTEDEIDDLLLFVLNPKSIEDDGPPESLVSVNPQEDQLLMDCELPTWNLPKHMV